jgi:protein phosphatase
MESKQSCGIEWSWLSVTGPVREENQDTIRCSGEKTSPEFGLLFSLADGMGGYEHGKIASELAVDTLFSTFYAHSAPGKRLPVRQAFLKGVEAANLAVYNTAHKLGAHRMGTTLTAGGLRDKKLHVVHVGDSRAYLIRDHKATCLTNDHSVVGDLLRMRVINEEQVRTHARRSVLTRAVGLALFVQPEVTQVDLQEGDRLVLVSDGVWSVVEDNDFSRLAEESKQADVFCQRLIDLALEREGDDNASAVAVYFHDLKAFQTGEAAERRWFRAFWQGSK